VTQPNSTRAAARRLRGAWLLGVLLVTGSHAWAQEAPPTGAAPTDSLTAAPAPAPAPATLESAASPETTSASTAIAGRMASTRKVKLDKSAQNVVRTGPGDEFAIAGVYRKGASFVVIAKSGDWYNVRLSGSETGWVHSSLCREYDDLADLEFKPNPKLFTRTGSFVLTGYTGAYAFDRKSNSLVLGGRLGYYVFDRIQAEGGVGWTRVHRPAEIVESLFDLSLEAEDFDMLFYHLILTYEILPGRQMVPYLSGGIGSTLLLGRSEPSFNLGAGTSLFVSKRTSIRWEFRDYIFRTGADDARASNNNIEFTIGTAMLF
jgi:outer membrane beta-barrel protein